MCGCWHCAANRGSSSTTLHTREKWVCSDWHRRTCEHVTSWLVNWLICLWLLKMNLKLLSVCCFWKYMCYEMCEYDGILHNNTWTCANNTWRMAIITTWRYASTVCAVVLCPSVRPSVTSHHCIKRAKCTITQTTPYDPGLLDFWCRKKSAKFQKVTPYRGAK